MKAMASGRVPYIALLEYRTTPISDCGKSPAQLLMSRRLISILPSTPASLQPVLVNPEDIQLRFEEKLDKQKKFYNRNARTRAGISVGDQIPDTAISLLVTALSRQSNVLETSECKSTSI